MVLKFDYVPNLTWDIPNQNSDFGLPKSKFQIWDDRCPKFDHIPNPTWDIPSWIWDMVKFEYHMSQT